MAIKRIVRLEDGMTGFGLLGAGANVVMQLSWPAVGYGVMESKVDSGKVSLHPIKRFRTTVSYLSVAVMGTEDERRAYREAVNKQHAQVRSGPDSPVKYNAFSRDLQLWVAACLYKGTVDVCELMYGELSESDADLMYQEAARLGTTLQVPQEMWPPDRIAFAHYWKAGVDQISIDEPVRKHLLAVTTGSPIGWPIDKIVTPVNTFFCAGFLPPEFREQMKLEWTPRDQRRFERIMRILATVNRLLPRPVRRFPFNFFLWDVRRRIAAGRPLV